MVATLAFCLAAIASTPDAPLLFAATIAVGVLSVVAQMGVAFAATLAGDAERGKVVGAVMSGLLLGILLARTISGYLSAWGGWRTPFWAAAGVMLVLAVVLWFTLPTDGPRPRQHYGRLLSSVVALVREEPTLRRRAALGACAFGAFSTLWTPLTFLLTGDPYHYGVATIGLFGLLGVIGAASASFAGRLADRGGANLVTGITAVLMLLSWIPIGLGAHWLPGLVIGILVLDLAVQGLHIINQSEIYVLRPDARSRLTSAYMTIYFTGGVIGSVGSAFAYTHGGWTAVSLLGAAFGLIATTLWLAGARLSRELSNSTR
jgi:predicted MFS family arabinose efflux permease